MAIRWDKFTIKLSRFAGVSEVKPSGSTQAKS
jgi:hypothetical protein